MGPETRGATLSHQDPNVRGSAPSAVSAHALLEVQGLSKSFATRRGKAIQETPALTDVTLSVREGELTAIIGPSGCGKSTLLRLMAGLIQPTTGRVTLRESEIHAPSSEIGIVFQHPALMKWRTVLANVEFGLECQQVKKAEKRERARHYIDLVGLSSFEHYYPHQLSGGMQQRVGLARALAIEPEIVFMDEPFGALDAQTRLLLQEEFQRIWMLENRTAILVTHDMEEAVYLGDRIFCMCSTPGRITDTITVPFGRPRTAEVRNLPEFGAIKSQLWHNLRGVGSDGVNGPG